MKRPGSLLLVGAFTLVTLIWSTTWAAIRVGLEAGVPPFAGVSLRFALAAAVLFLLAPFLGVTFGRSARERLLWLFNTVLNFCIPYAVVHWVEQWIPSGLASVLFATYPLLVAMLAHWFLPGERLGPWGFAGILLGFAGVAVIFSEDLAGLGGPQMVLAASVMLIAPVVSAVGSVIVKRWGEGIHPISLTAVPIGLAAGVMGIVSLGVEGRQVIPLDTATVSSLLYLGVFGSAVTFTLYFWLLSHIPATRLSLMTYLIPVIAVLVGVVFLGEPLTTRIVVGGALVMMGVVLAVQLQRKPAGSA